MLLFPQHHPPSAQKQLKESGKIMYHSYILIRTILTMMLSYSGGRRNRRVACFGQDCTAYRKGGGSQGKDCSSVLWNGIKITYVQIFPSSCSTPSPQFCCCYTASQGFIFFVSHSINLYELLPHDRNHFKPIYCGASECDC